MMLPWGQWGDIPVPGDYDGDGRMDLGVFRPGSGEWWILSSVVGLGAEWRCSGIGFWRQITQVRRK
jgi:hypothetical protein